MTTTLALRDDLGMTLSTVRQDVVGSRGLQSTSINLDKVRINDEADNPSLDLGQGIEVPLTSGGLGVLADTLGMPTPLFNRIGGFGGIELQSKWLRDLLNYTTETGMTADYSEDAGLVALAKPNALRISTAQVLDIAGRVLGSDDSPVQRLINTPAEFSFDVHVPIDSKVGIGGDKDGEKIPEALRGYSWATNTKITNLSRVGDITAGGLRVSVDRKNNRTPTVSTWMMRLACTNGMETPSPLSKVDARGMTIDEVMLDLEYKARLAFEKVEEEIAHFYDMRNVEVDNPERRLRAIARERGIPDRSLMRMLDAAPEALGATTNEFDVACLVSNLANHPSTRNDGGRLLLERSAGNTVAEHSVRCNSCNHILLD